MKTHFDEIEQENQDIDVSFLTSVLGQQIVYIRDMLFVNDLERRLGRRLTERELEQDELDLKFPDGHYELIVIPRLLFPWDLLSRPELDIQWTELEKIYGYNSELQPSDEDQICA